MKLKQIVFNSLQRPKSKHKKKHQELTLARLEETGKQPTTPGDRLQGSRQDRAPGAAPPGHVTSDTVNSNTPGLGDNRGSRPVAPPGTLNFNLNTAEPASQSKCACYKHLNPLGGSTEDGGGYSSRREAGYSSVSSSAEDSGFISLPKTRTLIKTNPWLPSPRSSPATSPDVSPTSSSSPSPVYTERDPLAAFPRPLPDRPPQSRRKKKRRERMAEPLPALNIPVSPHPGNHDYVNIQPTSHSALLSADSTTPSTDDGSDSLLRAYTASESDNGGAETPGSPPPDVRVAGSAADTGPQPPGSLLLPANHQYLQHCLAEVDSSVQTSCSGGLEDQALEQLVTCELLDTPVSFQYEEAFESQLEVKGVGQDVDSRDELSDGSDEHRVFTDPLGSRAHDFDSESCPSIYDSSPNTDFDSETETDDTVCDDYYTATGFRGHGRPGPFNDLFRDYYRSDGDESERDNSDNNSDNNSDHNSWDEQEEAGQRVARHDYVGSRARLVLARGSVVSGRGGATMMQEARLSLQEKVNRLRREKIIVDEKVQEAQEAEMLRQQERKRLRKEVNLHRKRLLLRTLQDLRSKLEEQSARLQQTYSAVLYMQQAVIEDRRQNPAQRRLPTPIDTREAPF